MVSKKWIVLAGLLMLTVLRTPIGLVYPCQADINSNGKVDNWEREILKTELGRKHCLTSTKNIPEVDQTTKFNTGDDKEKEEVTSYIIVQKNLKRKNTPLTTRFKDNRDGTVTDYKTGLMWTKNTNLPGNTMLFHQALDYIEGMNEGKYPNFGHTDWRLPALRELRSLINYTEYTKEGHILPKSHPFQNVQSLRLTDEKSISYLSNSKFPRAFSFYCRIVGHNVKSCYGYVWPVRSLPYYDADRIEGWK